MTRMLRETFERYGGTATVSHAGIDTQTKAFIQPLTRESNAEPFSVAPLGAVEERCWRYLGCACVEMGDSVTFDGACYAVRNAAAVYVGDEIAYYWAVLHPEEATA